MASGRTDAARRDECRYSVVVPVCLCCAVRMRCALRCGAVRCGAVRCSWQLPVGEDSRGRGVMQCDTTRHDTQDQVSSSHTRASLSHLAASPGRSAVVDEQMLPGTGPRRHGTRGTVGWSRVPHQKKGLEPVLTCLTWQMSLSLHSPSPPACSSKRAAPAWFDRAYILIKRHDGRWWLRGRSEDRKIMPTTHHQMLH